MDSILLSHSKIKIFRFSVHSREQIQKVADSFAGFTGCVWTTAESAQKSCEFKKILIRVAGASVHYLLIFSNFMMVHFFCLAFARKVFEWEAKVILKCDPAFEEAKFDVVDVAGDWVSQGKNEWQMGEL